MTGYVTIKREIVDDFDPDPSYLEQDGFEDRLEEYREGQFGFVGVRAVATIHVPYGKDYIVSTLKSPGLWGIESDSGEDYFNSVFADEKATLLQMIEDMGELEVRS